VIKKLLLFDKKLSSEENKLLADLNNTIIKFHEMIFNPMLNENVFEFSNFNFEEKESENSNLNRRVTESKRKNMETHFNHLINKCKEKVKLLNEENENLKQSLTNYENLQKNYEQEKTNYMKKMLDNKKNVMNYKIK
jgi:hypothetical protein